MIYKLIFAFSVDKSEVAKLHIFFNTSKSDHQNYYSFAINCTSIVVPRLFAQRNFITV